MRASRLALLVALLSALLPHTLKAQYTYWTGYGNGWQGQTAPANNGSANLYFSDSIYPFVTLSSSLNDFNSITLANGNNIIFSGTTTLTLTSSGIDAIASADTQIGDLYFGSGITINITGFQTFNAGQNSIVVKGQLAGTGAPTFIDTGGVNGAGVFILSSTTGNSYSGPTTVGDGANFVSVAFWNTAPFGTGGVTFNGGELVAHNTDTLTNTFSINSVTSANSEVFKSWDAPLTFTGAFTLFNNASFSIRTGVTGTAAPLGDGIVPLPGPAISYPVVFAGGISGGHHLAFFGDGVAILSGSDTWTGGTQVGALGSGASAGNLVFATAASIPNVAGNIIVNQNGYLGIADPTTGSFSTMLTYVNQASSYGSYGIDTLPGNSTTTYSGPINLSTFTSATVEIGSATTGEISGSITPQSSINFQFGGGGGTLYVDSSLGNSATGVLVSNPGNSLPLTVYLQGYNYYSGTTTASDGFIIFNGPTSVASLASGKLVATGSSSSIGGSYIGYTDLATQVTSPSVFLGAFNTTNTWGIVGFDSSVPASPTTYSGAIDMTAFNDGVFIGTATSAILTGTITPTSDDIYRFTAAKSGVLTIDSAITWGNGVVLGSPNYPQYSSGTIIMDGAGGGVNTYGGGTTINGGTSGLTVGLGSSTALGNGTVSISQGGLVGFEATNAGVILANPITFLDSASDSSTLYIKGSNSFQLSGPITGDSTATIAMDNGPSFSASITGDNSAYAGTYAVYAGTLNINLPNNTSLQNATLDFEGPGTIGLYGAANPIIQSIKGAENNGSLGTLFINSGVTATITTTNDSNNDGPTFGGAITGGGALAVNDTSGGASGAIVLLFGNNNYTGGTTVMNDGVLAVASSTALGTGPVTVATTVHGALALDSGVTLTNSMTYTSGNLVGDGTFAPSNLPTISVGTGDAVAGGLPFAQNNIVTGTLTFGGNLAFNNGGEYYWTLQDNGRSDGVSHIDVTGNLAVNATAGQFTIKVQSYDSSGNAGGLASNFNIFAPTSWAIVTAGSITGFSAADFTINSSSFEGGAVPSANFFLTQSGNQLMLNFTPVPEPSTWALLGAGLGMLGLAVGRVRRRAAAALSAA